MPTSTPDAPPLDQAAPPAAGQDADVGRLLEAIDEAACSTGQASPERLAAAAEQQRRLVEGRLGMATSLFIALRCKHPATAAHSLRVAIGCSAWAAALEMPDKLRSQLEIAALLHDVGKIGVPDAVLTKPGRLTPGEVELIDQSREAARQILTTAGAPSEIVEGVYATGAWHDGSHRTLKLTGDETPFVSRMIAIVDAFDAMTTDQVYRPARSRERAIATLYENAGTQFDPELVGSYCELFSKDQSRLDADVAARWLGTVSAQADRLPWNPSAPAQQPLASPAADTENSPQGFYAAKLIENMHDAVVFLDARRIITHWNVGAERLTGVGASAALGKQFTPSLLDMAAPNGQLLGEADCPVAKAMREGVQSLERVSVLGRNGKSISVELHAIPIASDSNAAEAMGATLMLRDVSSVESLEERCQALHTEMTKDPMTQVANRAEFDRMLAAFIDAHQETSLPCSLIMADIDHFKNINDTFGHQAGDEAIMAFAALMKSLCRSGDLVARYGGEEFAVLCADCNNATAAKRAEQIRKKLSETPHANLGGKHITASFGVTELQTGDTPETMLRRSDRALLQAKDQGRNQVVQLGDGMATTEETSKTGWFGIGKWVAGSLGGGPMIDTRLVTNVPIELAVEKLRGFVADHDAQILKTQQNFIRILAESHTSADDRPLSFVIEMSLSQEHIEQANSLGLAAGKYVHTYIDVKVQPRRDRDRRRAKVVDRARKVLGSLKSYLMARELDADAPAEAE